MPSSEEISRQTLRIIDASLNRAGEGLRLLEDVARLSLNDVALTQQLKTMRHELTIVDGAFKQQLLGSRNAEGDVGVDIEVAGEKGEKTLQTTVIANARRAEESLRTLEELARIPAVASKLDSEKFKHARFSLYSIEQDLLSRLLRQDKAKRLHGLYVIIDTEALKGRSHVEVARQVVRGGANVIQLRDKTLSKKELLSVAWELHRLCTEHGVLFIMNDYLDVALAVKADGLHVGQKDLPVEVARELLPVDVILGCSVTSMDLALDATSKGADYIAVGSMYPTPSKETAVVVGLETLRAVRQHISLPLVAIGGITRDNAAEVKAAGADAVAVIGAVLAVDSPEKAARQIVDKLEGEGE